MEGSTAYSFSASTLRQRHVPLREEPRQPSKQSDDKQDSPKEDDDVQLWECNICLDMASNPVVTLCGHLYCWPCIHKWMASRLPASNSCPVCKAGIDKEKVIPMYVRGREAKDPRTTDPIPDRPAGQRTEPTNPSLLNRFTNWNNIQDFFGGNQFNNVQGGFQFGIGVFPLFPFGFQFVTPCLLMLHSH